MAGSLSSPNLVKDVYTKLVWYNTTDGKFYRDNGSSDVEVLPNLVDNNILTHKTGSTISSGDLFRIINNSTEVFSVDYQGAVHLKPRTSAPSDNSEGTIYYNSSEGSLLVSVEE
tara:strand:- start:3906 stop:4247 length:342 start_codon:yes stop_codon:yes gene_type:complete